MLESVNQEAAEIIRRVVNWPHDFIPAQGTEPFRGRAEERIGNLLIIGRLEQAEAPDVRAMDRVVFRIVACSDPTHDFTGATREKELGLSVLEERVLRPVEKLLSFNQQGRHPRRVAFVNSPWELNERVAVLR